MIFVTLGSQKFQFNRLLKAVDELDTDEEIFAQIGYSDYKPQNYKYKEFLDREEFAAWEQKADIVITHGGTGSIVGPLKKNKKIIAAARLSKYGEHVDDHQIQIVDMFADVGYIMKYEDGDNLNDIIKEIRTKKMLKFKSNTKSFIKSLKEEIEK